MSGRDTCGFEENATATSATPSSSAEMPASATVSGTNAGRTSSPYTDFSPTPQPVLVRQSAGAERRTVCACAGAVESQIPTASSTPDHRMTQPYCVDDMNIGCVNSSRAGGGPNPSPD